MLDQHDQDQIKARLDALHARARDNFFVTYLGCFNREQPADAQETVAVAGTLVAALLSVAGTVAQDLNVGDERFRVMADEAYAAAVAGAPRWG